MENNIGVGLIIGLITASSIYVWNSDEFTKEQKVFLLIAVIFAPAQWLGILVIKYYNNHKFEKTPERKTEKKLDSTISNLTELKEKGILTEEEYNAKVEKIDADKTEQSLKNSLEYKQLKSLFESGVLTKDEFESKIQLLQDIFNKKTITHKIDDTTENKNSNLNHIRKIIIKDGTELTIHSYFTSGLREGDKVFINNHPASNGKYKLGWMDYIIVENGEIK